MRTGDNASDGAAAQQRLVSDYDTGGGDINTVTFSAPSMIRWGERFLLASLDLFAIPLFGPAVVKIASESGFMMALPYSTLSMLPIIEVASWRIFARRSSR
jgi:hypothetical protein